MRFVGFNIEGGSGEVLVNPFAVSFISVVADNRAVLNLVGGDNLVVTESREQAKQRLEEAARE